MPLSINGDSIVCITSSTYTIDNLGCNGTVNWTASPTGIVTINSPNGVSTTLTKIGSGIITLTANAANTCGTSGTLSKQISVGTPVPFIQSTTYNGLDFQAIANLIPGATYNWYYNGTLAASNTSRVYNGYVDQCGVTNKLAVQSINGCGTSAKSTPAISILIQCGGGPN